MQASYKRLVFQELDRLFRCGTAPSGDGALIGRFVAERNELAFEALVARHGPMVLGVCRRVLNSVHDADDAFQATFLVLARNAARVRDPDRLGPWLYGVATRVATKARSRAARHRHEPLQEVCAREQPSADWSDVMPILDDELGRLPAKHRDVLVLCLLQGASAEEASRQLGCPVGTVKSRLARGKETLRTRLTGRGIAPAVVVLLVSEAVASPVPATLTRATLETIAAAAVAPGVVALIKGTAPIMLSKSTVAAAVIVGGIVVAGAGTAAWMRTSAAQEPGRSTTQPPRSQTDATTDNMKQILLAFHNYHSVNNRMPAAALYGADGQPKLSWRVALLPYLGMLDLYEDFRVDEPWDSPHNKTLIARMPAVFETPALPAPKGQTHIRGFAGSGAMFDGTQGIGMEQITDGTSNTIMLTVARDATTWTQPGELPFIAGQPLPALDESKPNGFQIGLVDGSVRSLPKSEARMLPHLITRGGGEIISWPGDKGLGDAPSKPMPTPTLRPTPSEVQTRFLLKPTAPATTPPAMPGGMMSAMAGAPQVPTLEHRLARLEEKLDLVLRKLDQVLRDGSGPRSEAAVPGTRIPGQ